MKAFVIYKEGDTFSNNLAEECIQSANLFNIEVIKYPGIYKNIDELIDREGLFVNPLCEEKMISNGVKGCLLSHFSLWKLCIQLDEPIFVFEHDAVMCNPLPINVLDNFSDYLNLDINRKKYRKDLKEYISVVDKKVNKTKVIKMEIINGPGFKFMNRNHITGAHGYIIKPAGATKIVAGIKKEGMIPADIAPNSRYVEMFYTDNTVVKVNSIMAINMPKLSHTK